MARIPNTSPLFGAQGLIGGLIFRTVGDKTVVSQYEPPSKAKRKHQSELQRLTRTRFAEASRHAKHILRDQTTYTYYKKRAKKLGVSSPYTAAITDYMRKGQIDKIDTAKHKQKDRITIRTDKKRIDPKEVTVQLAITTTQKTIHDHSPKNGHDLWTYRYTTSPEDRTNTRKVVPSNLLIESRSKYRISQESTCCHRKRRQIVHARTVLFGDEIGETNEAVESPDRQHRKLF